VNSSPILILDYWNATPHFETSLEIAAEFLLNGSKVYYYNLGAHIRCGECFNLDKQRKVDLPILEKLKSIFPESFSFSLSIDKSGFTPAEDHADLLSYRQISSPLALKLFLESQGLLNIYDLICSSLHDKFRSDYIDFNSCQPLIRDLILDYLYSRHIADKLLGQISPSHCVLFNGRFNAYAAAYHSCSSYDIPVYFHDRSFVSDRYVLQDAPLYSDLAYYHSTVDNSTSDRLSKLESPIELSDEYVRNWLRNRRSGKSKDWYSFTPAQRRGLLPASFNNRQLNVTYFTGSNYELRGEYDRDERVSSCWKSQFESVATLANVVRSMTNIHLYIRLHPGLSRVDKAEWSIYDLLSSPKCTILEPDSPVDSYALGACSSAIFTYASSIAYELSISQAHIYSFGCPRYSYYQFCQYLATPQDVVKALSFVQKRSRSVLPETHRSDAFTFLKSHLAHGIQYKYYKPTGPNSGCLDLDLIAREARLLEHSFHGELEGS